MLSELTHLYISTLVESAKLNWETESRLSQLMSNRLDIWSSWSSWDWWRSVPMDLSTFLRENLSCLNFFLSNSLLDSMCEAPRMSFLRLSTLLTFLRRSLCSGMAGAVTQYCSFSLSPTRSWSSPLLTFLFHEVSPARQKSQCNNNVTPGRSASPHVTHCGRNFE